MFPKSASILYSTDAKIMDFKQSWFDEDMKYFIVLMSVSEYGGQYTMALTLLLLSDLKYLIFESSLQ